jgi:hypothetical protein
MAPDKQILEMEETGVPKGIINFIEIMAVPFIYYKY